MHVGVSFQLNTYLVDQREWSPSQRVHIDTSLDLLSILPGARLHTHTDGA